jgi:hypothetical protein
MHRKVLAAVLVMVLWPLASLAVTKDNFLIRNTEDLVALCAVSKDDPNYVAAIHFCHGFGAGAYRYYLATVSGPGTKPFVCLPDPPPSREAALQEFVTWAKANPQYNNESAVESLFRFLTNKWPCAPTAK